jgi:hypothetical protein
VFNLKTKAKCTNNLNNMWVENTMRIDGTIIQNLIIQMQEMSSMKVEKKTIILLIQVFLFNKLDPYLIKITLFISLLIGVFGYDLIKDT